MPTCPSCQHELKAGVKFCVYCGTAVQVSVPAPQPPLPATVNPTPAAAQPACPQCGTANSAGTKFCKKCGQPMGAGPAPAARPAPATASMKPAKRSALPLVAAGIAVAALGAGGFFGYQWWTARSRTEVAATRQVPFSPGAEALPPTPSEPPPAVAETPLAQPRTVRDASPVRATPPNQPVSTPSTPTPATSVPAAVPAPVTPAQQPEMKPSTVQAAPVAQAPVTQVQPAPPPAAQPEAPRRTEILRPAREFPAPSQARPAPGYSGPGAGVIVWSGQLEKGAAVSVNGAQPSAGTLTGALPGVPVLIEVEPKDVGIAEAPGPSNGWKGFSLRSRKGRHTAVTIRWRVL